jgi:Tetratricopeptide repeat
MISRRGAKIPIYEKSLGPEHPETDASRGRLAVLYVSTGAFDKAEALLRQSFAISERTLGPGSRGRDSGRAFLVSTSSEPEGYGLYSYLLFDVPPRDEIERTRYLKTLEAYLLVLQPITELERFKLRSELNITLIPVKRKPRLPAKLDDAKVAAQAAQEVLSEYNYTRARVLIRELGIDRLSSGPYLISRAPAEALARRLFQDMTHVAPHLVWDWVRAFCWLAAQERSWSATALVRISLNIRNAVALAAGNIGPVKSELAKWIHVVEGKN